jgi:uncharacterized coiled-coil protein SlyX
LADMLAMIKGYASAITPAPCSYNTITDYTPSMLDYLGTDDDFNCSSGTCTYTPDYSNTTGVFGLFYAINSIQDVNDPTVYPYKIDPEIWKPGSLVCPVQDDCDPVGTYSDQVDTFKTFLNEFWDWGYGYFSEDGGFYPGVVNKTVEDLKASFDYWFRGQLYQVNSLPPPVSLDGTFYNKTEKWVNWTDPVMAGSWTNPTTVGGFAKIKADMIVERDNLQAIAGQITADQQIVDDIQATMNVLVPRLQQKLNLEAQIVAAQAAVDAAQTYIDAVLRDYGSGVIPSVCSATAACTILDLSSAAGALNTAKSNLLALQYTKARVDMQVMALEISLSSKLGLAYDSAYCSPDFARWPTLMRFFFNVGACIPGDYMPDGWTRLNDMNKEINTLADQFEALGGQRRLDLLNSLIMNLDDLITKLTAFAEKVKSFQSSVRALAAVQINEPHEATTIYTWRDKNNKVHHVRVELAYPCNMPSTESYTKGFLGRTTCDKLINDTGRVGVRVTRFDEDQPKPMKFAFGGELWQFISRPVPVTATGNADTDLASGGISFSACAVYQPSGPVLTGCSGLEFGVCH